MGKVNLTLQIDALEAKKGRAPRISLAKYIKPMDADVEELRRQKIQQHLFHLNKLLARALKKAKAFTLQKLVKKIKRAKDEGKGVETLDAHLLSLKSLKIEGREELLEHFLGKCSDYCKEKCNFLQTKGDFGSSYREKLLHNNSFQELLQTTPSKHFYKIMPLKQKSKGCQRHSKPS